MVAEADKKNFESEKKPSSIAFSADEENNKYNELFAEIKAYLEKNNPFKDPDFSIQQLATELNSNSTYISRAINMNTNMNFKTFINKYRINQVKQDLNDIDSNKYTLMYIYTSAGFKYQSTFNKVFKQIENITPSEYIAQKNKDAVGNIPE
ncbi:helix-turn-helix domain-containing protein [Chryseobacterium salviniae]|uniref:AraC family transcriptional regulator n=1 Tax=Chryseobacterium salviniae TaxID=3101750 RepID=A0ABU6HVP0_9FLAO|nr:AraC family transcriptional regulator [Chryseobacterium sp. T9W2-O]MEC3877145.1 AraC family transcriptional regulator [Chryseobacterium sp. T9W2-O]